MFLFDQLDFNNQFTNKFQWIMMNYAKIFLN